jgi:hypothetical protein
MNQFRVNKGVFKVCVLLMVLLFGNGSAWADHWHHGGHSHFGVNVGLGSYWSPWYYPPPHYYYPQPYPYTQTVVIERPQPVYIEQVPPQPTPPVPVAVSTVNTSTPAQNDWYFCPASKAYYPYVRQCPSGWQKVPAQPPGL